MAYLAQLKNFYNVKWFITTSCALENKEPDSVLLFAFISMKLDLNQHIKYSYNANVLIVFIIYCLAVYSWYSESVSSSYYKSWWTHLAIHISHEKNILMIVCS
jgi:hypothetical protein